jgi:hypothetical protein
VSPYSRAGPMSPPAEVARRPWSAKLSVTFAVNHGKRRRVGRVTRENSVINQQHADSHHNFRSLLPVLHGRIDVDNTLGIFQEKVVKLIESDIYENLCAEFQYRWIVSLRDTLKKYGVPTETAKEICGEFSFDLSMMFDQGEIDHDGVTYRPVVAFTDDEDDPVLIAPDNYVEFHEYAFGTTDEAYESKQSGE